jgi:hypothetical protein
MEASVDYARANWRRFTSFDPFGGVAPSDVFAQRNLRLQCVDPARGFVNAQGRPVLLRLIGLVGEVLQPEAPGRGSSGQPTGPTRRRIWPWLSFFISLPTSVT